MLIGVVSDTHNNLKNIHKIVNIFNNHNVELVIHTGDITNIKSLQCFSELKATFTGVFGNNDLNEPGLKELCKELNFEFQNPPMILNLLGIKVGVFHEPDNIKCFLKKEESLSLIFHGHTHRYKHEKLGNKTIINPGESAGHVKGSNSIGLISLPSLEFERIFF